MKKELLEYSYKQGLSHIASAMSMLDYVDVLFTDKFVTPDDYIIIGKPFGAQAYYLVWQKLGFLDNIENLSVGVKHDEIVFVDYGEETMGNALGVAIGIAMTTDRRVWVNISDAALQMGNTLEAIQFIGHHNIKNIFLTIDYNNAQVTGSISNVLKVKPAIQFFKEYGWFVQEVDGHDKTKISLAYANAVTTVPNVYVFHTQKGHGVKSIEQDIKKWHYRKIETQTELQSLVQELQVT
jgi:transketolase